MSDVSATKLEPATPGRITTGQVAPSASGDAVISQPVVSASGSTEAFAAERVPRTEVKLTPTQVRNDFEFKVRTVKWFGILSAIVILLMVVLGFWYLDRIIDSSRAYESSLDFSEIIKRAPSEPEIVTLGLEKDALLMRNKRTLSALFMRGYSQFLGILAGTVLAILGAIFVLARVDSAESKAEGSWGVNRAILSSSSPGIFVTLIGALLVGSVVYFGDDSITATDAPLFSRVSLSTNAELDTIKQSSSYLDQRTKALQGIERTRE